MKEGEEGQMHHRKIVAKEIEKKETEIRENEEGRRRINALKTTCYDISLSLLFPPNLEGKENCGSRLPLTPFSRYQKREYTIFKVTYLVYSK